MATSAAVQEEAPATRFAKDQLKAIIERIERLEEEKKTISDDIRDVYAEGKGNGFDVKALRQIVRLRKQDPNERAEAETILETYRAVIARLFPELAESEFGLATQGFDYVAEDVANRTASFRASTAAS